MLRFLNSSQKRTPTKKRLVAAMRSAPLITNGAAGATSVSLLRKIKHGLHGSTRAPGALVLPVLPSEDSGCDQLRIERRFDPADFGTQTTLVVIATTRWSTLTKRR